ncbi:CpsD/CapB family tyrosine-protein kinase [Bacillus sp. Cr_A10]|uniref:CpsD/CapB family tyrosine-protein kinase n=1 Tax=Bacillus sp. Cr_A10 TaxID=3033993 RepID=UPI0031F404B5
MINSSPKSLVAEQIRTIRANINFAMKEKRFITLLITSTSVGEGKSTIASNIAISFAQERKKVLLIDADLRKPTIHYTFKKHISPGFTNMLMSNWTFKDTVKESGVKGLEIITCGPVPSNPAELLSSSKMDKLMKEMKENYDVVIFDAPPLLSVADAQILAEKCDGTILVVSSRTTEKRNLIKAKEVLIASKAKIVGAILNNYKLEKNHYYYDYYIES